MTICVAIKVGSTIYMAADSMVTGEQPKHPVSASGEPLRPTPKGPIADNCWKIYPIGAQQLLTYAGAERTGDAIADVLHSGYDEGADPAEQMKSAINSVKPMSEDFGVDVLVASPWAGETRLTHYDFDSDEIRDIPSGSWVILGSLPSSSKEALTTLIRESLKVLPEQAHPEHFVTVLLGLLMADARYFRLALYGIGGAFCGAYVTPLTRGWQPDILFQPFSKTQSGAILNGHPIHTLVRDNNFVVGTGSQGKTIRAWQSDRWDQEWLNFLTNYPDYGRTDYIVFYSTDDDYHRTVIVEMRKHKTSQHAWLETRGKQMRLHWRGIVARSLIEKKHGFLHIPFEANPNATENVGDSIASVLYDYLPPALARRIFDKMLQKLKFDTKYCEEIEMPKQA